MGNTESSTNANDSEETTTTATTTSQADDEPRWNEIEHENLLLEQLAPLPDITSKPKTSAVMSSAEQRKAADPESDLSLAEFKEQLANKRLARQTAVQDLREEIQSLRKQLQAEQAENRRLRQGVKDDAELPQEEEPQAELPPVQAVDEDDANPSSRSRHANIELANAQLALQLANAENLSLRGELDVVQRQVATLKEVICCCKQMLSVKEEQCAQLKMKLTEIENSFSEREMKIMSNNLRQEYERQLVNIRQLRQLYEERQRVAAAEYENLQRLISIKKDELIAEQEKTKNFEERNQLLNKELETANEELAKLREECAEHKFEKRILKEQVAAVNLLFSQLVMGFNGEHNMNIDRLTQMLEENRDLLNEMMLAEGSCSEGATLPKLLFELVEQATNNQTKRDKSRSATPTPTPGQDEVMVTTAGEDSTDNSVRPEPSARKLHRRRGDSGATAATLKCHEPEIMGKVATAQEIIGNLPKVWKVLMELLSHHKIERVQFEEMPPAAGEGGGGATASKAPELSVSKTYIKLKDLIMEKKSLVKETNRLKTLNSHLDNRLNEQEKRLSVVSLELTKTWHLVGKMQRQHRQLHTQEQILRYQLQQKRRLLSELKDELEYCRRKWALARAKNDESQELCNDWRREFARRKLEDANHSAESGYSDSGPQSDEEAAATSGAGAVSVSACRRKHLRDQFEHTRKIKRMQSTSPGRQEITGEREESVEIVLRWNSAPPTCGWRDEPEESEEQEEENCSRGAVPKTIQTHSSRSRSRQRGNEGSSGSSPGAATERIQKLEEQCKSLIQQVLETSGNRERLEIQLCRFQDEIAPAQHAVPLDEFINRKRLERMTRASSAPATGSLTPREEEYTRKRSERLGRLEEESRQLLSRIKRTADRGHYLKKSLDRIRRAPSREGSFESNTEEEAQSPLTLEEEAQSPLTVEKEAQSPLTLEKEAQSPLTLEQEAQSPLTLEEEAQSPLTLEEQAYTSRRAARLQRLEQESQQLLSQLARNTERGESLVSRLDTLHEQSQSQLPTVSSISLSVEQRLEDIERVSANRAERLRRLEQQGNELITRLSNTSERGTAMINRIAERQANRRQEAQLLEQTAEEATSCFLDNNNDMASSCIVEQEQESQGAACCVTVTTTSAQLAIQQSTGAIPKTTSKSKSKPLTQLCATLRHDDATKKRSTVEHGMEEESLESMVQRLRAIPYPEERVREQSSGQQEGAKKEETKMEELRTEEEDANRENVGAEISRQKELRDKVIKKEIPKEKGRKEEEPKKEGPKEEGPKEEGPKEEGPKAEGPKEEEPKVESLNEEGLKAEGPKEEGPKEEGPTEDEPKEKGDTDKGAKEVEAAKKMEEDIKKEEPKEKEPKEEKSKEEESKEEEFTEELPKEQDLKKQGAKEKGTQERAPKQQTSLNVDFREEEQMKDEPKSEEPKKEEPKEQEHKKQGAKEEGTQEMEPQLEAAEGMEPKERELKEEEPKEEEPKAEESNKE